MKSIWLYYRTTQRTTSLLIGYFVDNGAKKAKVQVIKDFMGKLPDGEKLKLPVADAFHIKLDYGNLDKFKSMTKEEAETFMRKVMHASLQRRIKRLLQTIKEE